ncbi:hypothetical protein EYC84_008381 [Monilinia fructicola]|uniref:Amino acid permease/ SLC12A domain-containing protein n=1 Tax=Monilinia fructicola TaxID=38448 RepID=A0A5M9JLM5_MONFR|nr:hypothetical protein EYC84_008381 [Monilinia fructicola]
MPFSLLTRRSNSKPCTGDNETDKCRSPHEKPLPATTITPVPQVFPSPRPSLDPNLPIPIPVPSPCSDPEKPSEQSSNSPSFNSPYPQVRAAVRDTDDPTLPCNTIRAWCIGLTLTTVGAGINCLFSLRSPSIAITTVAKHGIS